MRAFRISLMFVLLPLSVFANFMDSYETCSELPTIAYEIKSGNTASLNGSIGDYYFSKVKSGEIKEFKSKAVKNLIEKNLNETKNIDKDGDSRMKIWRMEIDSKNSFYFLDAIVCKTKKLPS